MPWISSVTMEFWNVLPRRISDFHFNLSSQNRNLRRVAAVFMKNNFEVVVCLWIFLLHVLWVLLARRVPSCRIKSQIFVYLVKSSTPDGARSLRHKWIKWFSYSGKRPLDHHLCHDLAIKFKIWLMTITTVGQNPTQIVPWCNIFGAFCRIKSNLFVHTTFVVKNQCPDVRSRASLQWLSVRKVHEWDRDDHQHLWYYFSTPTFKRWVTLAEDHHKLYYFKDKLSIQVFLELARSTVLSIIKCS